MEGKEHYDYMLICHNAGITPPELSRQHRTECEASPSWVAFPREWDE